MPARAAHPALSTLTKPQHEQHLYLHIPYCQAKCPYCDFNSIAGRESEFTAYVDALITEIQRLPQGPYETIFIGGGTPTILPSQLLTKLCQAIRHHIHLSDYYEWTCEANPGTVDADRFATLAEHGVNRLSIGVQSLQAHHLAFLGRVHDAAQAHHAIALAKKHFPRVSADLMIGLPGQTADEIRENIKLYDQHALDHASVYHLMIEPGTEFHARMRRGNLTELDQELSEQFLRLAWDELESLGLLAYETSNFAKLGMECRHNLAYWTSRDYQAAGAGAVSSLNGHRVTREPHPGKYIHAITTGQSAIARSEQLSAAEQLTEAWMLGLRLIEGVSTKVLESHGDSHQRWRPIANQLIEECLLQERQTAHESHLALTTAGRILQDHVTVSLMPEIADS